tara:strand:- start:3338 stop:4108 length:771 start_codon:yes stop_codon:yes gene_type:complete
MSCSTPSGGLRKQIISQLCVLNINNTAQPLIKFFAKKNEISDTKTINHANEIVKTIEDNANLTQGQTVLSNITKRSSKIIKHLDDNKVRSVFSDISVINNGIMKKVNEQEKEELIRKISALTVGMGRTAIKEIMDEVDKRNEQEIDPVELAKIKKIISNMFDYKGSPMPNQTTPATNALTDAATAAADAAGQLAQGAKDSIARRLGGIDTNEMKKKIIRKVATTDLRGGSNRTRKRRRTKNHRHSHSHSHSHRHRQ